MISSMFVPICNHFHVKRAYSGKITLFKGGAPISPSGSRGSPLLSEMKFCHEILETIGYHTVKTEVSISPGLGLVPGRDGQTDRITVAIAMLALARKK